VRRLGSLKDQDINKAKEILAFELTKIVHGQDEADKALKAARAAFGGQGEGDISAVPTLEIGKAELAKGIGVIDLFSRTDLCPSKSEARRLITQGGAVINEKKIDDINTVIDGSWLEEGALMLKAGKKRYYRITVK